jgi:hypothetical protein
MDGGMVVLAAAHNEGANKPLTFPADLPRVFCIGAADGFGNIPNITAVDRKPEQWSALGVAVSGATIAGTPAEKHSTTVRTDGCSTATPIAAGIASLCLDYIRQFTSVNPLNRPDYIRKLFIEMSEETAGRTHRYLAPLTFPAVKKAGSASAEDNWKAVAEILNKPASSHAIC